MVTYKKSDLWKAAILIMLIVAAFWLSFRTIMNAGPRRSPVTTAQQVANQPSAQGTVTGATNEMFAPRDRTVTQLLVRGRSAPDPFRPYASLLPPQPANPPAASPASQPKVKVEPPQPGEVQTQLRLVGLMWGARPIAVLISADGHHYARAGDALPGGWRLSQVDQRSVLLTKGKERARLQLQRQDEKRTK